MFFTRYVFTADGGHQDDWAGLGIDHRWLRPAVRHDAVQKNRPECACDVAFVGSNDTVHLCASPTGMTASAAAAR